MSRQEPLQRRIILHLARGRPQTINETAKGIERDYKSSWVAFKKLEKKGLIKTVKTKYYRGNQYPYFWLTEVGVLHVLDEGANPKPLFKQTLETYSKNKILQFLIEAVPIFGKEIAGQFDTDILIKDAEMQLIGLLSTYLLPTISPASQMRGEINSEELRQFRALLKKYPELYQHLTEELKQIAENLKTISTLLENSE